MFSPPPFLCHFCSCDLQASSGFHPSRGKDPLSFFPRTGRIYIVVMWLQNPALPAAQVHLLSIMFPLIMHKASFNSCGRVIFSKAMATFSLEIKTVLVTGCYCFLKIFIFKECFRFLQRCGNGMMIFICDPFA